MNRVGYVSSALYLNGGFGDNVSGKYAIQIDW